MKQTPLSLELIALILDDLFCKLGHVCGVQLRDAGYDISKSSVGGAAVGHFIFDRSIIRSPSQLFFKMRNTVTMMIITKLDDVYKN